MRKKNARFFSIEKLFNLLSEEMKKDNDIKVVNVPFNSSMPFGVFGNMIFAFVHSRVSVADAYHISGDIHYLALVLRWKKTILTIHDLGYKSRKSKFKSWVYDQLWFKLPCYLSAQITVVSEFTKHNLLTKFNVNKSKLQVVSNFYDPELKFNNYSRVLECEHSCNVLQIGTKDNKNLSRIIDAIENSRDDSLVLHIVGQLTNKQLEQLTKRKINYKNYVGLSNFELYSLIHSSEIITFVSLFEGFGMPIIEGNVLGVPVITSDLEPMVSVAGGSCILVDPHNINEISSAISNLKIDQDLRHKLISRGIVNAEKYSISTIVDEYYKVYKKVVE
ncbi:glycosyltransferase [Vibrio breoganii]|nr:glycosyltransferase [Vibrio breoganii]